MDDEVNCNVSAILPAGGVGSRVGSSLPKQFCKVKGKPLLYYSIKCFESVPWIEKIVVPIQHEFIELLAKLCDKYGFCKVSSCNAGNTRFCSIYEGIKALEKMGCSNNIVVICDAARPFMDYESLRQVTLAARDFGAAGVTRPLTSTVLCPTADQFLDHSLDRTKHVASEMPQAFQFHLIRDGFAKATPYDFEHGTECLHVAQKYGGTSVKLIPGTDDLWKVTYQRDFYAMEHILTERESQATLILVGNWQNLSLFRSLELAALRRNLQVVLSNSEKAESRSLAQTSQLCSLVLLADDFTASSVCSLACPRTERCVAAIFVCCCGFTSTSKSEGELKRFISEIHIDTMRVGVLLGNVNKTTTDYNVERLLSLVENVFSGKMEFLDRQVLTFTE